MPFRKDIFCILCNSNIAVLGLSYKTISDEVFSDIITIFGNVQKQSHHRICQKCSRKIVRIKEGRCDEQSIKVNLTPASLTLDKSSHTSTVTKTPTKQHPGGLKGYHTDDVTPRKNGKRQTKDTGTPEKPRKTRKNLLGRGRSDFEIPASILNDPRVAVDKMWQSDIIKNAFISKMTNEIQQELEEYCSRKNPSILREHTADSLISLSHDKIVEELKAKCPLWYEV